MLRPLASSSLSYQTRREVVERLAPCYRAVSCEQKGMLLDTVVDATGYARKYAIRLLNQEPTGKVTIERPRPPRYGPEVQHALVLAWEVTKRICAKRLIPFLPTLVDALERHGHLQLSQENRDTLLSMSVATAERVLRSQPSATPHGRCTTKAGPLLKQQIPIRTFHQWDDARPGFLEADLVAHCGGHLDGGYVSTLTLTDVATGWTECLPLLYKGPDAVLAAFQHARQLFPFPILGLDTDNGSEFINHDLLAYCEREQITFTRGRPEVKNDQCFVEQKNGAIVRHFVGYDRLTGQQAYLQLRELYRGMRLLVNCFQPSMKLQSKLHDGQTVRRLYDAAKTPLQRLLLSGVLPVQQEQALREVAYALDPLELFEQVEQLQQAVWRSAVGAVLAPLSAPASHILPFSSEWALGHLLPPSRERTADPCALPTLQQTSPNQTDLLNWPRSTRDPFRGEWERILSLILAHPERSSGAIFQELQRVSPGRYTPSHLSTLQHGIRTIRARLLATMEEPWPDEVIQAAKPDPIAADLSSQEATLSSDTVHASTLALHQEQNCAKGALHQPQTEEEREIPWEQALFTAKEPTQESRHEESQPLQALPIHPAMMTIEGAIQAYLQDQRAQRCTPKTLEWHQTALGLFQQYLINEHHRFFLSQITGRDVGDWSQWLHTQPMGRGKPRGVNTITTYLRSVRAFGNWMVRHGYLKQPLLAKGSIPRGSTPHIQLIEPDLFERLLQACGPAGGSTAPMDQATMRNRAILWVLRATGIKVSELCGLHFSDVDGVQGTLKVRTEAKARVITLPPQGRYDLLCYLDEYGPKETDLQGDTARDDHLFRTEMDRPLTPNAITLLFGRLKKRAMITEKRVSPLGLRDTFAVAYLQRGGTLEALGDILGLVDTMTLKRYQRLSDQGIECEQGTKAVEYDPPTQKVTPQKGKRHRRRSSSAPSRKRMQRESDGPDGSPSEEPATHEEDDP